MFLNLNLSNYPSKDAIKLELQNVISFFPNLNLEMRILKFRDNVERNLITLSGTIQIHYEQNPYNIPLTISLPDLYPLQAPLVYVIPTFNMEIRKSRYVDEYGRINPPYLAGWNHITSNLVGLIVNITKIFGEEPPLCTKLDSIKSNLTSCSSVLPISNAKLIRETVENVVYGVQAVQNQTTRHDIHTEYAEYNTLTGARQPTPLKGKLNSPMIIPKNIKQPEHLNEYNENLQIQSYRKLVQERYTERYNDMYMKLLNDIDYFQREGQELIKKTGEYSVLYNNMRSQIESIVSEKQIYHQTNKALTDVFQKLQNNDHNGINYDQTVDTTAPLYRQLLKLFIEEQSLDDTIYILGEVLGKKLINIDLFLKKVRELSRRQFVLKALIMKCRDIAKLDV